MLLNNFTKIISIVIALNFFNVTPSFSQDLQQLKSWQLYKLSGRDAFVKSIDSLGGIQNSSLSDSLLRELFRSRQLIDSKNALWTAAFYTTYSSDPISKVKLLINLHNGQLFDAKTKDYYSLPESLTKVLLEYLNNRFSQFK